MHDVSFPAVIGSVDVGMSGGSTSTSAAQAIQHEIYLYYSSSGYSLACMQEALISSLDRPHSPAASV